MRRLGRGGQRITTRFFVARLHDTDSDSPSRFGFVVSKQVGGAVVRNLVKRRLRALAQDEIVRHPHGRDVLVRALPGATGVSFEKVAQAWREAFDRVDA
jgi:ribonuclease P protein component